MAFHFYDVVLRISLTRIILQTLHEVNHSMPCTAVPTNITAAELHDQTPSNHAAACPMYTPSAVHTQGGPLDTHLQVWCFAQKVRSLQQPRSEPGSKAFALH